jgi:hypothetical protein
VGNGGRVKVRIDPWVGFGEAFRLSENIVNSLHEIGFFTLGQVIDLYHSTIWIQEWKPIDDISLHDEEVQEWMGYISFLKASHVRISVQDDELSWFKNPTRDQYTPKLGYKVLYENEDVGAHAWWFKHV